MSGLDILPNRLQMSDLKIFLAVQGVQSDKAAGQTRQGDFRLGQTGVLIYHLQLRQGRAGLAGGWSEILSSLIT